MNTVVSQLNTYLSMLFNKVFPTLNILIMKLLNVNHCSRLHVSFLCLLMVAICLPLSAQTTQDADAAFKEFVRLNNTNGDRTTMFNMLYTYKTD